MTKKHNLRVSVAIDIVTDLEELGGMGVKVRKRKRTSGALGKDKGLNTWGH